MVANINGKALLKVAPVQWDTKPGVMPSSTLVYVTEGHKRSLLTTTEDVALQIGARIIEKLIVLRSVSASGVVGESVMHGIILTDRRWLWRRKHYSASFNVRRRTGQVTISADHTTPLAVRDIIPIYRYLSQTLNNLQPYTLKEALEKVLKDTNEEPFTIPADFPDVPAFGARGFEQHGSIAEVVSSLLKFAPGWSLTCDDDGTIRFYNKIDLEGELAANEEIYPKLYQRGFAKISDLSKERPKEIRVLFFAEPEIRFDYDEGIDRGLSTHLRSQDIAPLQSPVDPTLEAVIRVPVPDLQAGDGSPMARDSLTSFYHFLHHSLNTDFGRAFYPLSINAGGKDWDYNTITKIYLRSWDVKSQFVHFGGFIDTNWGRIVRTTLRDFRTHYRLQKDWADRVREIKPFRVELLDSISLTRQKSPVFSNYISKPALRMSSVYEKGTLDDLAWVITDACYNKATDEFLPLNQCKRAPARIVGVDSESKSFKIFYDRSPRGRDEDVFPVEVEDLPKVVNFSNLRLKLEYGQPIVRDFRMSTVLTCLPQPIPGGSGHLHEVTVTPKQAAKTMGISEERLGECKGPIWEILIPASPQTTARFCWTDEASQQMIEPFFITSKKSKDGKTSSAVKFPESNLQNKDDIEALANSSAAAIYFSLLDRLEGRSTAPARKPPPQMVGSIKSVRTMASPGVDEIVVNVLNFGAEIEPRNPYNNLPAEVRNRLLQLIVPGGGD